MDNLMRLVLGLAALGTSASAFAYGPDNGFIVPEPGTLSLLVTGVVGLLVARRFRRK